MRTAFFAVFLVAAVVGVVMFTAVAVGVNAIVRRTGAVPWRLLGIGGALMVVGILGAYLLRPATDDGASARVPAAVAVVAPASIAGGVR